MRKVLRDLQDLGMDLAEWRYNKTADAPGQRAATRHKIRQVVARGINAFTYEEMAKELDISRQQLDNIRKERPTGRGNRGEVAEAVLLERETYRELVQLGASYMLWGSTDGPERDNVRRGIRAAVDRARDQGVSRGECAELLGISVEQLRTILRKAAEKAAGGG